MKNILNLKRLFIVPIVILTTSCSSESDTILADDSELNEQSSESIELSSAENIQIFPSNHPLNKEITNSPVDSNSDIILENIGLNSGLFTDFGSGLYNDAPIGIPYVVVDGSQENVPITFSENGYPSESDKGPFPIPLDAPIEGNGKGDSHVISVDVENGMLYELFNSKQVGSGFEVSSAAVFDLNATTFRPDGWTSADAAGLPIFPLLVRYSEIEKGEIDHPIRFTIPRSKIYEGYIHPARHLVSGDKGDQLLPFGAVLRLKSTFDTSNFSETNKIILKAMKKYGLILADVGSNMFISGAPDDNWNNDDLRALKQVTLNNFEVIQMGEITTK
ncbi:hypothetical protein ZORO111903_13335 [Zobellia roscoffensis]|uniref:hypothetical protein n=1 Tax=Zobellia roscoffensis TaxID=2779508 RepID=UPI001D047EE9|nr:hypothetical protein [Zobellia roscoffensis]